MKCLGETTPAGALISKIRGTAGTTPVPSSGEEGNLFFGMGQRK
jgi:hypothetical protein